MKILMVTTGLPPGSRGGTETHVVSLASHLARQGHDVVLFCREGGSSRAPFSVRRDTLHGLSTHRIAYGFHDASTFDKIHRNVEIEMAFRSVVVEVKPDLVHVHHLSCLSTGILDLVASLDIPLVMTLHDYWLACPRGQRIMKDLTVCQDLDRSRCAPCLKELWPHFEITPGDLEALDLELLARVNRCDLLLAPSEFHRARMTEWGVDPNRLHVEAHGLDSGGFEIAQRLREGIRTVGYIGSLIPSKGVHVLIEAWNQVGREDVELVIHGEAPNFHGDSGYLERLNASVRSGLKVRFGGPFDVAGVPRLLRGIDLLVVPPVWWESFCLTAREGFLAGVPVVASRHGALVEAFDDGKGGVFFEPGNASDLAAKLRGLIDAPKAHAALAASVPSVRSMDDCARATAARYASAIAARRHARAASGESSIGFVSGDSSVQPYVTVFLPTWNGLPEIDAVLAQITRQVTSFPYEVLIIDSGSTDGTLDVIRKYPGIRLLTIPNDEFNHGLTRNRGVAESRGDIVALLTQDAEPLNEHWLAQLVSNFQDPKVAGVYCTQRPRPDCNPFARDRLKDWTAESGDPVVQGPISAGEFAAMRPWDRYLVSRFDDVASCVRKSAMIEVPYARRQFGEDVEWGSRAVVAGWKIVNDPKSVVIHSHDSPVLYEFKRVYLDHQNLFQLFGLHTLPRISDVPLCSVRYFLHLLPVVWRDDRSVGFRLWWTLKLPLYAFTQNLAQWLGAKSVQWRKEGKHSWVDALMKKSV